MDMTPCLHIITRTAWIWICLYLHIFIDIVHVYDHMSYLLSHWLDMDMAPCAYLSL